MITLTFFCDIKTCADYASFPLDVTNLEKTADGIVETLERNGWLLSGDNAFTCPKCVKDMKASPDEWVLRRRRRHLLEARCPHCGQYVKDSFVIPHPPRNRWLERRWLRREMFQNYAELQDTAGSLSREYILQCIEDGFTHWETADTPGEDESHMMVMFPELRSGKDSCVDCG